jgi:hypothetical protein
MVEVDESLLSFLQWPFVSGVVIWVEENVISESEACNGMIVV